MAAYSSNWLLAAPHLKQRCTFRFRLAEKQQLPGDRERCTGHGPRTWFPEPARGMKPTRSRTAAIGFSAWTARKQMPGIAKPVADGGSGDSAYCDRNPGDSGEEHVLTARRGANLAPSTAGCCSWSSSRVSWSRVARGQLSRLSQSGQNDIEQYLSPYVSLLQPDFRKQPEKPIGNGQSPLPAFRALARANPSKVAPCYDAADTEGRSAGAATGTTSSSVRPVITALTLTRMY